MQLGRPRLFGPLLREGRGVINQTRLRASFSHDQFRELEQQAAQAPQWGDDKEYERAKNMALRILSYNPKSSRDLREKLEEKGISSETITKTIDRLQELGLHDDAAFASAFARGKWNQSRWSPSRIKMELKMHGLDDASIAKGMAAAFSENYDHNGDDDDDDDDDAVVENENHFGREQMRMLVDACERQLRPSRHLPKDTQRRRIIGWLQRRGYQWDTLKAILPELGLGFSD